MKRKWFLSFLLLVIGIALLGVVSASALGVYGLDWWTVDGGGGTSTGGSYALSGTIGQPNAGVLAGGGYTLAGGFWGGAAALAVQYHLYLPLVLKNYGP